MKVSAAKFVLIFLISGFVFQFASNSILGPEVRLFPANGEWFPGTASPIAWKKNVASIIYPVKIVLAGPLAPVFKEPDGAPPILFFAFAIYWTAIALVIYFLLGKIRNSKKQNA